MRPKCTVHVKIEGRVQGVGYRAWVEREALALALTGWVRNRRDGSVEAVFQGPEEEVKEMVRLCAAGPAGARVTHLDERSERAGVFRSFDVLPTA